MVPGTPPKSRQAYRRRYQGTRGGCDLIIRLVLCLVCSRTEQTERLPRNFPRWLYRKNLRALRSVCSVQIARPRPNRTRPLYRNSQCFPINCEIPACTKRLGRSNSLESELNQMARAREKASMTISDVRRGKSGWQAEEVDNGLDAKVVDVRCHYCKGEVRVHHKHKPNGPTPHVEHKSKQDSTNCKGGHHFNGTHRTSQNPVR